jgi:hypothetical protein
LLLALLWKRVQHFGLEVEWKRECRFALELPLSLEEDLQDDLESVEALHFVAGVV